MAHSSPSRERGRLAGIHHGGQRARPEDDQDREVYWIPLQKRCGGYGEVSDGGVVVWVVAADFLAIHNSVDWGLQDHFKTTISVPYGSKSAFECHSCLLVSVVYQRLANS